MKKSMKLAVAGLAAVAVVGGSFAYWNVTAAIDNEFSTSAFGGEMTENFNPVAGSNWQPGGKVTKEVGVTNTGAYPIKARIKFEEKWEKVNADGTTGDMIPGSNMTSANPLFFPKKQGEEFLPLVSGGSRVYKEMDYTGWEQADREGWIVTTAAIQPGAPELKLLKSVTLLPDAVDADYEENTLISVDGGVNYRKGSMETVTTDNGGTKLVITYTDGEAPASAEVVDPNVVVKQKKEKVVKDDNGYANAKYTLTITTQLAQLDDNNQPMWPQPQN